jgi:hypothetical protein
MEVSFIHVYDTLFESLCSPAMPDAVLDAFTVQNSSDRTMAPLVSYFKSITRHAYFVLRYEVGAFFLSVVRIREEHAFVALRLFICADTAGLNKYCQSSAFLFINMIVPLASLACRNQSSSLRPCWRLSEGPEPVSVLYIDQRIPVA